MNSELRPDWKKPIEYKKYNLSNNVCIDESLNVTFSNTFNHYPDPNPAYQSICDYYRVDIEHTMLGFGIGELFPRMLTYGNLGSITVLAPTWPMLEVWDKINNLNINYVQYTNFVELNIDLLKTGLSDTLYLANPNGINGQVLSKEDIVSLLPYYKFVICDEAYMDFSDQSMLESYRLYNNLIILKTFSKTIAMPGLRFGFCVSSNTEFINNMQLNRPNCVLTSTSLHVVPMLCSMIDTHIQRMKYTRDYIESKYDHVPSQGNFVLLKGNHMIKEDVSSKEVYPNIHRLALFNIELLEKILK